MRIKSILSGLAAGLLVSAGAQAATINLDLYFDTDGVTTGNCTVSTPSGVVQGVDEILRLTVDDVALTVSTSSLDACDTVTNTFHSIASPVGTWSLTSATASNLLHGEIPLSVFPGGAPAGVLVAAQAGGSFVNLLGGGGGGAGGPSYGSLLGVSLSGAPIPANAPWALLLMAVFLAAGAGMALRRKAGNLWGLAFVAASAVAAAFTAPPDVWAQTTGAAQVTLAAGNPIAIDRGGVQALTVRRDGQKLYLDITISKLVEGASGLADSEIRTNSTGGSPGKPVTKSEYLNGVLVASNQIIVIKNNTLNFGNLMPVINSNGWTLLGDDDFSYQIDTGTDSTAAALATARASGINAFTNKIPVGTGITNDAIYSVSGNDWNLTAIGLQDAWNALASAGATTYRPVVGVVDGGFRYDHEDLSATEIASREYDTFFPPAGNLVFHYCDDGDGSSRPKDGTDCGNATHGMNVASIMGATSNNSKGITGVAPGIDLKAYRYTDNRSVLDGLNLMLTRNARIINFSLGYKYSTACGDFYCSDITSEDDLVAWMIRMQQVYPTFPDVLIIQASGNNGDKLLPLATYLGVGYNVSSSDFSGLFATLTSKFFWDWFVDSPYYSNDLAAYLTQIIDHTIIVGSYDQSKKISSFTSRPTDPVMTPFILVPGGRGDMNGSYIKPGESANGQVVGAAFSATDRYITMSGTSQAAPHVAGVAALILKANPALTAPQVKKIIFDNADTIETYKALNAAKAVQAALATLPVVNVDFSVGSAAPAAGDYVTFTPQASSNQGGIVAYEWSFGDGGGVSQPTGTAVQHQYSAAGTYQVTLTVTDSTSLTNTVTKSITVAAATSVTLTNVSYLDATGVQQIVASANKLTGGGATTLTSGWYVCPAGAILNYSETITISGNVNLILADGCKMTVVGANESILYYTRAAGIYVSGTNSLTVYAQSTNAAMGSLTATGGDWSAGIGGSTGAINEASGNITISGGTVTAICVGRAAAGIGGGAYAEAGDITINGSAHIIATGGNSVVGPGASGGGGAGIGSGGTTDFVPMAIGTIRIGSATTINATGGGGFYVDGGTFWGSGAKIGQGGYRSNSGAEVFVSVP